MQILFTRAVFAASAYAVLLACTSSTEPSVMTAKTLEPLTPTVLSGTVGTAVYPAPTVRVKDSAGNPLAGVAVTFEVDGGGGTVQNTTAQTNLDGLATVAWTLGIQAMVNTMTVRALNLEPVLFMASAAAAPPAAIEALEGDGQTAVTGTALPSPLKARVADSFGNWVPGAVITFDVISGGGVINGAAAVSDSLGVATSGVWMLGTATGSQQVRAKSADVEVVFTATATVRPDFPGTLVFVSQRDGNDEIYSIRADGTELTRLTTNAAADLDPAWSPDGTRIAFASDRDGSMHIYVMNADGSNVVRRSDGGRDDSPAWSPDGRQIAFSSLRNGDFGIHVMDVDGDWTNPRHRGHPRGWNAHPAWSPDGSRIAFVSDWDAFDFVYDLYVMDANGSNLTVLIKGPFFAPGIYYFQPAWSPDGRSLAMVVCPYAWDNCYPDGIVSVANADGSEIRPVENAGGFARPAWSPDGSTIAFGSRKCRTCVSSLRAVKLDGSSSMLIFANGHSPSWR